MYLRNWYGSQRKKNYLFFSDSIKASNAKKSTPERYFCVCHWSLWHVLKNQQVENGRTFKKRSSGNEAILNILKKIKLTANLPPLTIKLCATFCFHLFSSTYRRKFQQVLQQKKDQAVLFRIAQIACHRYRCMFLLVDYLCNHRARMNTLQDIFTYVCSSGP